MQTVNTSFDHTLRSAIYDQDLHFFFANITCRKAGKVMMLVSLSYHDSVAFLSA